MIDDDLLDCPFVASAFAAFVQQARAEGGWPDPELTRRRAYELFETEKRKKAP